MKKIISIEGMACEHCVASVKNALEMLNGVKSVKVELKKNSATVKLAEDISDEAITNAITEAGFIVNSITAK
ncbi:MAG: copper ion binding protein [Acetobacter sp.]|nr:copper ion binding protein [Bacteroides sp.]MCM1341437.1 copper ion binding protein [Acetobacter sp.]